MKWWEHVEVQAALVLLLVMVLGYLGVWHLLYDAITLLTGNVWRLAPEVS